MKKLVLLVCFLMVSSFSYSQILEENFDYTLGDSLTQHGWVAFSGTGVPLEVTSPGLTYTDYAGSGIGLATTVTSGAGSRQDAYKSFTSTQTSGSIYTSMMINVIAAPTTDEYFAAYLPSTSTSSYNGRLYCKDDGAGNISFGISKTTSGSGSIVYGPATFTTGVTYVLVLKYTFNIGATDDDVITLYAFDGAIPSTEPAPYAGPVGGTATDLADLDRFALRQAGSISSVILDGIYIETTWNNAVLPVELSSFTSSINNRDVTLNWSTASEINNSGFDIERSSANSTWTKVGNVTGNGTTNSTVNYSYTDRGLATGNYSYRLKQIDFNGNFEYFNLSNEINIGVPAAYQLSQNYPNPFNPSTTISYDIPNEGVVSLKLFDMSGKEVSTLVNEVKTAGYYSVNFNASNLSSGIYFYELRAENFSSVKKMMLVK